MNIYDAIETNKMPPTKIKNTNKEVSQDRGNIEIDLIENSPDVSTVNNNRDINNDTEYVGYFTPADQSKIELAYLKNENKIKRSDEYKGLLEDQLVQQVNKIVTEIDGYDLPTFGVSDKQFKSMALLMANAEDKEAMREKLEPALLFSNAFEIPLASALENIDSLSEIYGLGINVDKGNLGQKVKGAWKVGSSVSKLSEVGNKISLITDRLNELSLIEETGKGNSFIDKAFTAFGQVLDGEIGYAQSLKNNTAEELTIELEELKKEADDINKYIMKNTNSIDNGMWNNLLLATSRSLPYMLESVSAGAEGALMMGAAIATLSATGLTAGTSLSATAGLASHGVGALMKGKSLVAAAASLSSFQKIKSMMKGSKYLEYIENGVDHETAKISSDIFGSFAAAEEILFDALPMQFLGSILGRKTGPVFIKNAIQRFGMSGKPARGLMAFAGAAGSGLGEGFTEFSQYFTEAFADAMVYSKQETGSMLNLDLDDIINAKTIKEASEQFAMGFGMALLLGAPSTFFQVSMNIDEYNQISKIMQTSESKVGAINEASKIAPETSKEVFEKFWDKTQEIKNKTIKKTVIKESGNAKSEVSNNIETPKATPSVVDTEKLSYSDTTTRIKGNSSLLKNTTVRDAKGIEVGSIKRTEVGNTISINDVDIEEPKVMYNALKNIISNNVGKNILLNSKGDVVLEQIKQTLIEENPRGEEFGLSWYVSTNDEIELSKKIKVPFNLTEEQARVSSKLIANLAKHENLTATQYWNKHFPNDIDTKTLDADESLKDKKGAIKFLDKERLQAVLYTSQNSDVSTFTHETFHLAIHQMANKGLLAQYIKNWVKTDEFKTFFDENRKKFGDLNYDNLIKEANSFDVSDDASWTFTQDEISAFLFEIWQADRTIIKNKEMSSLFEKIADWFKDIYSAVKSTVKMNEDISNYFNQMYGEVDTNSTSNLETKVNEPSNLETKVNEPSNLEKYNEAKFLQQQKISEIQREIKKAKGKKKENLLLKLRNVKKDLDGIRYQSYEQGTNFDTENLTQEQIKSVENNGAFSNEDANTLFQAMSEEEIKERAIVEAMFIEDFETYEVIYKANNPDFVDKTGTWLKDKFEQAKQRAGLEKVEYIYKSASTDNSRNIIFKKSLENNEMSDLFIRKAKEFKRRIERVRGNALTSDIFQINARLLEDIELLFANTEVMKEGKINSVKREALRKVVEENPSQARIIFAKLNGLDYMMSDFEYDDTDYFDVFANNYDSNDNVLSGAVLSSTKEEVRQKMKADYKLFLENKNAQAKNLKTLLENVRKQRDASVKKNKGMASEIQRLNAKYKEDVSRILKEYKTKIKDLEEGIEVERTSRKISEYKVTNSVRSDSARDLSAFKALLNVKERNNFRTAEGEPWSATYVHNLIRDYLGEYYASLFTAKMIEENMKNPNTQQGFVSEELNVLLAVMDNIKKDGIKKRNADMLAINTRVENNTRQLQIATQASLAKFKEGKLYKAIDKLPNSDKITPIISGIFTGTFNIPRKAMLLDGLDVGKDGAWYKLLIERRRAIKDLESLSVDRRKSGLNDILQEYNLNPIKLSKTVLETDFGGFKQKHSAVDLGYYYISQFNDDNKTAVAGGHLMTAEERLSETMTHDEFEKEALRRYDIVLKEATKLYDEHEGYQKLFDAIIKEFNGEVMQKMNMLMMKTRNKQSQAIKNYLAIQRKGQTTTEVLAQFEIDIDENDRYDNIDSTAFAALRERKKIDIRKQTDINTDVFDLISKTIDKQEHLLANYEYVYELKQTFTSAKSIQLREAVTNGYGKGVYEDIITFIEEVANPYANKHDTALDNLVKPLKGNIYPAFLGARTPVVIMQMITSPAAFMGKMNVFQYLGSFMHTLTNRGEVISKVNELSPFMKNRSWDYAWSDSWTARHQGDQMTHNELVKEHVLEKLMGGLKWADQTTVYSGWNEMFEQELNRLGLSTDENIKKAVKYADDFVRDTQPLSDVTEIAPLFKSGEAGKLFTQFTASLSPIYQNVFFDTVALKKQGKGKEAVGMMLGYAMVGALLFAARGGYEEDDDAEMKFKKFIASTLSQPTSSLPLIGSVAEYLVKYAITGDSSGLYSTSKFPMFDKLTSGTSKFIAGDYAKGFSLAIDAIMIGLGLPVGFKTDVEKSIEEMRNDKLPLSFIGYDR